MKMPRKSFALLALAVLAVTPAAAQRPGAMAVHSTVKSCTYEVCALAIAPVWYGLALERGTDHAKAGVLGFFLPHDVRAAFEGSDSAQVFAKRALRVRRAGAVLTDLGGALIIAGATIAIRDKHFTRDSKTMGIAGASLLTFSVPAQFIADGHLSRAVWWYNLQFAQ